MPPFSPVGSEGQTAVPATAAAVGADRKRKADPVVEGQEDEFQEDEEGEGDALEDGVGEEGDGGNEEDSASIQLIEESGEGEETVAATDAVEGEKKVRPRRGKRGGR